jgi:cytochrome P450/NADPH-cytochrome P450 reductase
MTFLVCLINCVIVLVVTDICRLLVTTQLEVSESTKWAENMTNVSQGLLSFTFFMMLKHPRVLHRAQAEVDEVLGNGPMDIKQIEKLKYLEAVLRETIRLHPTVTAVALHSKSGKDELIGNGKYRLGAKDVAILGIAALHRDPTVWGEDANDFRPERMLDGGFEALPPNSWKPFGNGVRSCIGRGFAWQEAVIAVALILQRFQVEMADPSYELKIRQTLTIKPVGWHMKVRLRPGKSVYTGLVTEPEAPKSITSNGTGTPAQDNAGLAPLSIFYGSNQGTCRNFAESLQGAAASHGFAATVATLDSATEHVPNDRPVIFITPSYEGQPPDNGRKFVSWLESIQDKSNALSGVKYAVFGCGNPDWVTTYHRIPKLVEEILDRTGATKLCPTGLGNAAGDIIGAFDAFSEEIWAALQQSGGRAEAAQDKLQVKVTIDRPEMLGEKDMTLGTVRQHVQIADTSVGPRKMLLDVDLPGTVSYQAGDYLVVLPTNHRHNVRRVLQRFDMPADALVKLSGTKKSFLVRHSFSERSQNIQLIAPATRPDRVRIQHRCRVRRNRHSNLTQADSASRCSDGRCRAESRARTSSRDSLRVCRPVEAC